MKFLKILLSNLLRLRKRNLLSPATSSNHTREVLREDTVFLLLCCCNLLRGKCLSFPLPSPTLFPPYFPHTSPSPLTTSPYLIPVPHTHLPSLPLCSNSLPFPPQCSDSPTCPPPQSKTPYFPLPSPLPPSFPNPQRKKLSSEEGFSLGCIPQF